MEIRELGKTGIRVSAIGMGCEGFEGKNPNECNRLMDAAVKNGISFFDMYTSNPKTRKNMGNALKNIRVKALPYKVIYARLGKTGNMSERDSLNL